MQQLYALHSGECVTLISSYELCTCFLLGFFGCKFWPGERTFSENAVKIQWKFSECFSMQFCIFNLEPMAWFANCRVCRLTHAVRPAHQSPKSMWSQCAYEAHLKASNAQKRDQKFKLILLDLELPSWKSFQAKVSLANFWFWSSRAKGFWIRTSDRATEESQKF